MLLAFKPAKSIYFLLKLLFQNQTYEQYEYVVLGAQGL
jgi:hypothetical protein